MVYTDISKAYMQFNATSSRFYIVRKMQFGVMVARMRLKTEVGHLFIIEI